MTQLDLFGTAPKPTPRRQAGVAPAEVPPPIAALAAKLPRAIRLGTSSWSFPGWAGIVYRDAVSQQRLARQGLAAYARHPLLRTVGIDRTYYGPIASRDFAAYAAAVPDDFRFLVKAHEACTTARWPHHERYGAQRGQRNPLFLDPDYAIDNVVGPFLEGLGDKGGPLLFQFPPQDVAAMHGDRGFAARLERFLAALPRGPLYAIELRHGELLDDEYVRCLQSADACHCFNLHPSMPQVAAQAAAADPAAMPATVIRWMLRRDRRYEDARASYAPFDHIAEADPEARRAAATLARNAVAAGKQVFIVINNKAEGSAPLSAQMLAEAIVGPS